MPFSSNAASRQKNHGQKTPATAATVPSSLTKQCLQLHHPEQRFNKDAIELSSEFLKLFVVEARRRAAIEAECEAEAEINPKNRDDASDSSMMGESTQRKKSVEIRADHIAKIAAELLLDLS